MLLEWLGSRHRQDSLVQAARAVDRAADELLAKPESRTRDLGGLLGTKEFAAALAARVLGEPGAR